MSVSHLVIVPERVVRSSTLAACVVQATQSPPVQRERAAGDGEAAAQIKGGEEVQATPPFPKGPSPIKLVELARLLGNYTDHSAAAFLWDGFIQGFRIHSPHPKGVILARNLRSVRGMKDIVQRKIAKEVGLGRVLGPFPNPPV